MSRHEDRDHFPVWGFFFIIGGLLWGAQQFGLIPFTWSLFGPLALVAVGVSMLLNRGRCGMYCSDDRPPRRDDAARHPEDR